MMTNESQLYGPILQEYLSSGPDAAYVVSPFISLGALEKVLDGKQEAVIVTSWKYEHLKSGVSTLDLFPLCKERGWKLHVNDALHAKIYSLGLESCHLGSANCTDRALFSPDGNIECFCFKERLETEERREINRIIAKSTLVTERVYDAYVKWLDGYERGETDIERPDVEPFEEYSLFNLPATDDPLMLYDYLAHPKEYSGMVQEIEHDLALFSPLSSCSKGEFLEYCRKAFFESKFVAKVENLTEGDGVSYGRMSSEIHSLCTDFPVPYRKDVKRFVHNIFQWFVKLDPGSYEIIVPRHSEILRKRHRQHAALRHTETIIAVCGSARTVQNKRKFDIRNAYYFGMK